MEYKTHIATTFAIGLPLLVITNEATLINSISLVVGSILPDIDHPKSFIGRKSKVVSTVTNKTLGHRGGTHSLIVLITLYLILCWIVSKLGISFTNVKFWIALGYFCHLLEDSFSKEGIKWFWPFQKHRAKSRGGFFYYKTGDGVEKLILGFTYCLILIEFRLILLGEIGNLFPGEILTKIGFWILKFQKLG